jgi:hypothetical protein
VQLWLTETYGLVDFDNPRQLALLDLLGVRSLREVFPDTRAQRLGTASTQGSQRPSTVSNAPEAAETGVGLEIIDGHGGPSGTRSVSMRVDQDDFTTL